MIKKTGLENILLEEDDVEKIKMAGVSTLKQVIFQVADDTNLEKATIKLTDDDAEIEVDSTPRKISAKNPEMAVQEHSTEKTAQEDSPEMTVGSIPEEDLQEKAELAVDKDFELIIAKALKKVILNLSA